ncbi:MAG: bifunctional UDP-4-keto-pentose/UDP-xylose synthase [Synergistaceae bacterium]|nr:bifunctional UDP-4-keto-pentose/UDP-xylose synthase [Synergistaceae bacterium]
MNILLLGANGFIGSHLVERILSGKDTTGWNIRAFDIEGNNLEKYRGNERFSFRLGDIFKDDEWIEEQVKECDVTLPFVGIAKPAYYLSKPLWTFELDFEQNLKVVRMCVNNKKRVIFPSTSEVYGMSPDKTLTEDESALMVGPISKMRWIYSCSKQMLDRVIVAYGQEKGLKYTIFRPFNWIGARLDTFKDAEERSARSITQMVYDILNNRSITLVNGGAQRRSFTYISDGIDALIAIIRNVDGNADGQIFNIGNPWNNVSIKELAYEILKSMKESGNDKFMNAAESAEIIIKPADEYYGNGYDDMQNRVPSIENIKNKLAWTPKIRFSEAVRMTVSSYL